MLTLITLIASTQVSPTFPTASVVADLRKIVAWRCYGDTPQSLPFLKVSYRREKDSPSSAFSGSWECGEERGRFRTFPDGTLWIFDRDDMDLRAEISNQSNLKSYVKTKFLDFLKSLGRTELYEVSWCSDSPIWASKENKSIDFRMIFSFRGIDISGQCGMGVVNVGGTNGRINSIQLPHSIVTNQLIKAKGALLEKEKSSLALAVMRKHKVKSVRFWFTKSSWSPQLAIPMKPFNELELLQVSTLVVTNEQGQKEVCWMKVLDADRRIIASDIVSALSSDDATAASLPNLRSKVTLLIEKKSKVVSLTKSPGEVKVHDWEPTTVSSSEGEFWFAEYSPQKKLVKFGHSIYSYGKS